MTTYFVRNGNGLHGPYSREAADAFLSVSGGDLVSVSLDLSALQDSSLTEFSAVVLPADALLAPQ